MGWGLRGLCVRVCLWGRAWVPGLCHLREGGACMKFQVLRMWDTSMLGADVHTCLALPPRKRLAAGYSRKSSVQTRLSVHSEYRGMRPVCQRGASNKFTFILCAWVCCEPIGQRWRRSWR
jgi:hypothetical protein